MRPVVHPTHGNPQGHAATLLRTKTGGSCRTRSAQAARIGIGQPTGEGTGGHRYGGPTAIEGQLTLHGVTNPLNLRVNSFQCNPPAMGRSVCGADASGSFNRDDYGVDFGMGRFLMYVNLEIQVEGVLVED